MHSVTDQVSLSSWVAPMWCSRHHSFAPLSLHRNAFRRTLLYAKAEMSPQLSCRAPAPKKGQLRAQEYQRPGDSRSSSGVKDEVSRTSTVSGDTWSLKMWRMMGGAASVGLPPMSTPMSASLAMTGRQQSYPTAPQILATQRWDEATVFKTARGRKRDRASLPAPIEGRERRLPSLESPPGAATSELESA